MLNIKVDGLKETMDSLKTINKQLVRDLKKGIRQDAKIILEDARNYASGLGGRGTYAQSLAMRTIKDGVRIQSDDPAAGVKEFAKHGAVATRGKRRGKLVGVPMGNPPRALVKSSEENQDLVVRMVEDRVAQIIERALNG